MQPAIEELTCMSWICSLEIGCFLQVPACPLGGCFAALAEPGQGRSQEIRVGSGASVQEGLTAKLPIQA